MADSDIKALTEAIPGESFETTAFTTPPPLADATVAIVTTASLHHPDQDDFEVMDTGYRVLGKDPPVRGPVLLVHGPEVASLELTNLLNVVVVSFHVTRR